MKISKLPKSSRGEGTKDEISDDKYNPCGISKADEADDSVKLAVISRLTGAPQDHQRMDETTRRHGWSEKLTR